MTSVTKAMALDETLQATNGKMDTVVTKLQGIIDALGVDTSVYKAAGNKTCAELVPALLVASNLGNVYNITDSGTTTSDFVEGSGKPIHIGDNVAVVDVGTGGGHVYKFDLLAGMVDLSNYVQKSATAGLLKNDGTVDTNDYAEKVSGATNGNLAGLNGSGNLMDSGWNGAKDTTSRSGNPISISGLKSNQLAVNPIITLEPIQAGSGTPSPSNIRAISGYDKIEVLSCGKNILDLSKLGSYQVTAGGTMRYGVPAYLKAGTYTFSKSGGSATLYLTNVTDNYSYVEIGSAQYPYTFSVNANSYVIFRTSGNTPSDWDIVNAQLEEGQTATTYEPCNKTTDLSESLGQTVYGGTLDVRTGKFTVTHGIVDLGSIDWDIVESTSLYKDFRNISMASNIKPVDSQVIADAVCEIFKTTSRNEQSTNHSLNTIAITLNGYIRVITNTSYADAAAFKTAMSGKMFAYELATPFTIQLTPHEISLLKDYAYVSTNGTSIALDYHNGELASLSDVAQVGETVNLIGNGMLKHQRIKHVFGNVTANNFYDYNMTAEYENLTWSNVVSITMTTPTGNIFDHKGVLLYRPGSNNVNIVIEYQCGSTATNVYIYIDVLYV